ncbi:C4-dicarboxylate transporter/malic acid transport protein [Stackebrandtia nassauensis DSM 44728]|uniref:C4-dicarboxylate transporter/malic acid transport protein n=1 Tax=Stackebrandtia nassauensis (strain DSM 44728 / CIP 108903 / NRRL B-16338 / NBRC 102104 / LLR-40K-21) TaxID=446470 RepID=D3QAZ2_STANL|nr:C4-dicarboxylate transporter/malic acid transport protein [Stackebrandtia nassauensis DSM 44728]
MKDSAPPRHRAPDDSPLANIGPNWFASVMGTGIVANAAIALPYQFPGQRVAATVVWLLASAWLTTVTICFAAHWLRHRDRARKHHTNPVMAQFYGAPPMAFLTIGAGALNFAPPYIGVDAAYTVALGLWFLGTATGLLTAVAIPYLMFTKHEVAADAPFAGWLMPVVPPMVSAATGAALIPHIAAGQPRETMLLACYAMFGISLLATMVILPQVWSKLVHHGVGAAAAVPTLWICLGPLGQSVTAAGNLGKVAPLALGAPVSTALDSFGLIYGVPVLGFALLWIAIASAVTIRTVRNGMPFALTWWSFTFPVGTCVTGAAGLATRTELPGLEVLTMAMYGLLLSAWLLVGVRTARGIVTGKLLAAPPAPPAPPAAGPQPVPTAVGRAAIPRVGDGESLLPIPGLTPVFRMSAPPQQTESWSPPPPLPRRPTPSQR